jgi:hypothetical protein
VISGGVVLSGLIAVFEQQPHVPFEVGELMGLEYTLDRSLCQRYVAVRGDHRRDGWQLANGGTRAPPDEPFMPLRSSLRLRLVASGRRSPLAALLFVTDHPFHEYRDGKAFQAINRPDLLPAWSVYWPSRSQTWDAIAVALDQAGHPVGPVLVEAKSYPQEFRDRRGTRAGGDRRDLIAKRLAEARHWLGVEEIEELADRWLGEFFQSANRFATLRFFRHYDHLKPLESACLVNIYFVDDQTHLTPKSATSRQAWDAAIVQAEQDLGLAGTDVEHSGRVFLDAETYAELVKATGG